jgi:hypothetical protein
VKEGLENLCVASTRRRMTSLSYGSPSSRHGNQVWRGGGLSRLPPPSDCFDRAARGAVVEHVRQERARL